jgi:hypothetical protein
MKAWGRLILIGVVVVGLVCVGAGAAFITLGVQKHQFLTSALDEEQITLGISDSRLAEGEIVDTMKETQIAGDIVREHRHEIAPTYGALLGGKNFDPTNPTQLTYAQAMNIENYLYLATNSFGVTYLTMGIGAALIGIGAALIALALTLNIWAKRVLATSAQPAAEKG